MITKEVWADVKGYEGIYKVSSFGNVKSLNYSHTRKPKNLKPSISGSGYLIVGLHKNKKSKSKQVHQLVAIAFLNHTPFGHTIVVNHINFNKIDNTIENLELVTARENSNLKHIKSTSKYVGVSFDSHAKKWRARIIIDGFNKSLGMYKEEINAHLAYQQELKKV